MMLRSNPLSVFMRKNAPDTRPGQNCGETDFLSRIRSIPVPAGLGSREGEAPVPRWAWLPRRRSPRPLGSL